MAAPGTDTATFGAIDRALRQAVQLINADKKKYLHHIIADLPPELGPLQAEDFRLSRLRYVDPRPYPSEEFDRTHAWMVSWGLAPAEASFEQLVDNRVAVTS
jgi:NitT/TauT family transport system substrate-binding protein